MKTLTAFSALAMCALSGSAVGGCTDDDVDAPVPDAAPVNTAFHLTMRDGTRIAVDLWRPANASAAHPVPTIVRATRYSRDHEVFDRSSIPETESEHEARAFAAHGYAQVIIDARGSSASFGVRPQPWSPAEVADYAEIVDWIVAQPWSNGRLAAFGTSYDSNTAEMIGTLGHAAVKVVVPRFGYPDIYRDIVFPGGIFNEQFVHTWLTRNLAIDANDVCGFTGATGADCDGANATLSLAKPVDADDDRSLLAAAVAEHATSPEQYASVSAAVNADDRWNGTEFAALSPGSRWAHANATGTAFLAWASWMDLGTARGALDRWRATDGPMVLFLGPWNHDAHLDASVYADPDALPSISVEEQFELTLAYLDTYLTGAGAPPAVRKIVYFTMGEDIRKETSVWPPAGTVTTPFYLHEEHALSAVAPAAAASTDRYVVDFTASTGVQNGWWTKLSAGDVVYPERSGEDAKLLVYTSAPLAADTEITGHASVTLHLATTASDGAVFVYLEDVAPDGTSTFVSEGQLRLRHRRLCSAGPRDPYGPCHSFLAEDARPMVPGVAEEVTIGLAPTSALVRAGHSIRVALGGADASTFARIPAQGTPEWTVVRDAEHPSRIDLPIAPRR